MDLQVSVEWWSEKFCSSPAIYPEDSKILGSCRGEPIYAREHVYTVSNADLMPCALS